MASDTQELLEELSLLKALVSIARSVSSSLKLERVLEEIVAQIHALVECDACSVMLVDRGYLTSRAGSGATLLTSLKLGEGLVGVAADQGRIMLWDRLCCPESFPRNPHGLQSMLMVPMRLHGHTVGTLALYARNVARSYCRREIDLLAALASQAAITTENAKLYEERDRVTELLSTALIPDILEFPPLRVAHQHFASKTLSGDYYDLIPLGGSRVAAVIADVAGKGPEAGIHTVRVKHIVRSLALSGATPTEILDQLNRQSLEHRTVTVFYAEIDLEARSMRFCRGGHEPALLWSPRGLEDLEPEGVLVGALDEARFQEGYREIPPGGLLLLYTDGLTEARSPMGEFFGLDAVRNLLLEAAPDGPQAVVEELVAAVGRFSQGSQADDLSILALGF